MFFLLLVVCVLAAVAVRKWHEWPQIGAAVVFVLSAVGLVMLSNTFELTVALAAITYVMLTWLAPEWAPRWLSRANSVGRHHRRSIKK